MAYAAWSVSFGEQPSAAKWNILGTNDATFDALVGSGTAWSSWTPTLTNMSIGNGTVSGRYQQFGKTVFAKLYITFGSTTSVSGAITATFPVTSSSTVYTSIGSEIGTGACIDAAVAHYPASLKWASTTTFRWRPHTASGTYATESDTTSTAPFTWATGDGLSANLTYEAA